MNTLKDACQELAELKRRNNVAELLLDSQGRAWELVLDCGPGEQRFFRDLDCRYAVADRSGPVPERTEDGILWMVPGGKAEARIGSRNSLLLVFEVSHCGETKVTASNLKALPLLQKLGYHIEISPTVAALYRDIGQVLSVTKPE